MDRTVPSVLYIFFRGETQMKSPTFRRELARKNASRRLLALGAAGVLADVFEGAHIGPELPEIFRQRGERRDGLAALLERAEEHPQARHFGASRGHHEEAL